MVVVSAVKIVISMAWFVVLGLNTTMGVAWQFTVWPNVWFKRKASGRPALGALPPMMVDGKPLDFTEIEDLDEDALGVAEVEDFTWKVCSTSPCTECGRCQSQCPAWHEKPLSLAADHGPATTRTPRRPTSRPPRRRARACPRRSGPRPPGRWSVRSRPPTGWPA